MAKPDRARTHDWVGARVVTPDPETGETAARPDITSPATFHVWKCSADRRLYLITPTDEIPASAPECKEGCWRFVKSVVEEGRARVGFSEAAARRDIDAQGFHLVRIDVPTAVGASDDGDAG
jgi:hypothetical protein